MAIGTYDELKTSIANWLARDDLTAKIPDFITMAEARMSREMESRAQAKRVTATCVVGDAYILLPSDVRSIRNVQVNTTPPTILKYMTPSALEREYPTTTNGKPKAFTVIGGEIKFGHAPDSTYVIEITYLGGIPTLSASTTTSTILTRHPDCYLYGSLFNAYAYLMDQAQTAQFGQLFTIALEEAKRDEDMAKFSTTPVMQPEYGE